MGNRDREEKRNRGIETWGKRHSGKETQGNRDTGE